MVKDIAIILKELGINLESETLLEDITNKLLEYSVVSENELLGIQNVSVQPLPTIIKNDEKNLKQRMVGIVSDQEKGAVSIINKRTVLLTKIVEALKNKVESFTDLGEINTTPTSEENDVLNNIKTKGVYSFNLSGFQYIMLVHTKRRKTLAGFIRVYEQYIFDGSRIIVRITNDSIDYWDVETNHIASKSDLDETKQEILNTLDTRLGNFKWLGIINENIHQSNVPILNSVVEEGFYTFGIPDGTGGSVIEFMTVSKVTTNSTRIIQHIFSTDALFFTDDAKKVDYYISHTIRILSNNVWSVHFENIITGPTIDAKITTIKNEIIGNVSADYNNLGKIEQKLKSQGNSIDTKAEKTYVDEKFNQILGEGASETLDTIGEISKALKDNEDIVDVLNQSIATKADKKELFSKDYNDLTNKPTIPTKVSQLEQDIEVGGGVNEIKVAEIVDNKIADLVNSAPETLDTLGELAQAIQENDSVVEALNSAIGDKADKDEIPTKLSQLEQDVELGVSEDDVMEIVENNSATTEEINIGTSTSYDETSDNEVPTTKAVKSMIESIINNALEGDY